MSVHHEFSLYARQFSLLILMCTRKTPLVKFKSLQEQEKGSLKLQVCAAVCLTFVLYNSDGFNSICIKKKSGQLGQCSAMGLLKLCNVVFLLCIVLDSGIGPEKCMSTMEEEEGTASTPGATGGMFLQISVLIPCFQTFLMNRVTVFNQYTLVNKGVKY